MVSRRPDQTRTRTSVTWQGTHCVYRAPNRFRGPEPCYWVTQATAIPYPNTGFYDPEFRPSRSSKLGLPTQAYFELGLLSSITLASWLAPRKADHRSN